MIIRTGSYQVLFLLLTLYTVSVHAEPVQYCLFGDTTKPKSNANFCLGVSTSRNASTGAHDVSLTFTHTRPRRSTSGWTAVGSGDSMTGSLMFILYGDPTSGERPIVSIRTATGHHQPTLLTRDQLGGGDLRVLRSDWVLGTTADTKASHFTTAIVSLICYSCPLWPGQGKLSATTTSQPWIWAWNKDQAFDVYSYDAHLRMHAHHVGNGGWGRFYVNMAQADQSAGASAKHMPSVPVIRPGVAMLGTSEQPGALSGFTGLTAGASPALRWHAGLMALAFLALFPAGVVAMRSGARWAFTVHWILQGVASAAVGGGMVAGLALQREINTTHQVLGLVISGILGLQALLGWKHHVDYVRIQRRTWISHLHIWTGRSVMLGAQANLLLGLLLHGVVGLQVGFVAGFMVLESSLLAVWVRRRAKLAKAASQAARYEALESDDDDAESLFTIASPRESKVGVDDGGEDMNLNKDEE